MKISDVEKRVAEIESHAQECSGLSHHLEDDLFLDVLKAIANGARNPKALAAAAIKSADLELNRWYE